MKQGTRFNPSRNFLLISLLMLAALSVLAACVNFLPMGLANPTATPTPRVQGEPQIRLEPASGYAGVYVRVSGQNWPANVMVILVLQDEESRSGILAASTTELDGRLNTGFLYPISERWIQPGQQTLLAYTVDGNLQATALFQVAPPASLQQTPTTTVSPTRVPPTVTATRPAAATPVTSAPTVATATQTPSPQPTATSTSTTTPTAPPISEWRGEYWANPFLQGNPVLVRNDSAINFDWGTNSPDNRIPVDGFSARWTRVLYFDAGLYTFIVQVDDGMRLYIDGQLVLDDWRNSSVRTLRADHNLSRGNHELRLEFYEQSGTAVSRFSWERKAEFAGWRGEYFANPNLLGEPVLLRDDPVINFAWGTARPAPGLPEDRFSVRWQRSLFFDRGLYRFTVRSDDGVRFWIDDALVIDQWQDAAGEVYTLDAELLPGAYALRLDYYENTGAAQILLSWEQLPLPTPSHTPTWTPTFTATASRTATPSATATPTATATATATSTATATTTPTVSTPPPSEGDEATATATATLAPSEPTMTATALPSATSTATATAPPASEGGAVQTATPTVAAVDPASEGEPVEMIPWSANWIPVEFQVYAIGGGLNIPQAVYALFDSQESWDGFGLNPLRNLAPGPKGSTAQGATRTVASSSDGPPQPIPASEDDLPLQIGLDVNFEQEILFLAASGPQPPGSGIRMTGFFWDEGGETLYVEVTTTQLRVRLRSERQVFPSHLVTVQRADLPRSVEEGFGVVFFDSSGEILAKTQLPQTVTMDSESEPKKR